MATDVKLNIWILQGLLLCFIMNKFSCISGEEKDYNDNDYEFALPEFNFTHYSSQRAYSYDDIMIRIKAIKTNLYNNITKLSEDDIPPPRGSKVVENNDHGYVEIITKVAVWLHADRIVKMDVEQQSLTILVKETFIWRDEALTWSNSPEEVPIDQVTLNASEIWLPVIYADNIVDEVKVIDSDLVTVYRDGICFVNRVMQYSMPCSVNITDFPFDTHNCSFELKQVRSLHNRIVFIPYGTKENHSRADVFSQNQYAHLEWRGIAQQSPLGDNHHGMIVSVILQRRSTFYAVVLIFPTVLLNLLSLVVFTLPINNTEREDFALNLILTYFVLVMIIVETSPPTGDQMPKLGLYVILCTVVVVLTFGMSLILIEMHEHKRAKGAKMPKRLSWILQRCCCLDNYLNDIFGTTSGNNKYNINDDEIFSERKSNSLLQLDVDNMDIKGKKVDQPKMEEFKWKYLAKILNIVFFVITLLAHFIFACLMFI